MPALCEKSAMFDPFPPPMAKGTAVTAVFPCAGRLRFLLSPKTQMMSYHRQCFTLKMPDCGLNPLVLPCGHMLPRWWGVFRLVTGKPSYYWAPCPRGARAVQTRPLVARIQLGLLVPGGCARCWAPGPLVRCGAAQLLLLLFPIQGYIVPPLFLTRLTSVRHSSVQVICGPLFSSCVYLWYSLFSYLAGTFFPTVSCFSAQNHIFWEAIVAWQSHLTASAGDRFQGPNKRPTVADGLWSLLMGQYMLYFACHTEPVRLAEHSTRSRFCFTGSFLVGKRRGLVGTQETDRAATLKKEFVFSVAVSANNEYHNSFFLLRLTCAA